MNFPNQNVLVAFVRCRFKASTVAQRILARMGAQNDAVLPGAVTLYGALPCQPFCISAASTALLKRAGVGVLPLGVRVILPLLNFFER